MASESSIDNDKAKLEREIEALLFASDAPLSAHRLASLTGVQSPSTIRSTIESLDRFYREASRSFQIVEVAGGYQITTLPDFSSLIAQLFKSRRKARLSQPALETLAIIAYKQPISRVAIEAIRGVNCDGVLSTLMDRDLIVISGRGEGIGRPYLYSTTGTFLEYLGLKDYRDLPSIADLEKKVSGIDTINEPPTGVTDETSQNESSYISDE